MCIAKTFDLGDPRFYEDFLVPHSCLSPINRTATPWARATNNVKKPQSQMCESCRKLDLRFLSNKTETFYVSVTHLILRLAIVQNKFQQANKTKINHINGNHIEFEVSLHFGGSGLLCATHELVI